MGMSNRCDSTNWCHVIKEVGKDARFRIKLGTESSEQLKGTNPNAVLKKACVGKTILQIFVPEEMLDVCGVLAENGLESGCLDGMIFAFEDCMVEFNYGTFSLAGESIEEFSEVPADTEAYPCYYPVEHFVKLDYKGQTVTNCGYVDRDPTEVNWEQDGAMFGERIFVSLSGGKTFYLCSGECNTIIRLK